MPTFTSTTDHRETAPAAATHAVIGRLVATHATAGRTVSVPIGDAPYDLIVDRDGEWACVSQDGTATVRRLAGRVAGGVQLGLFPPPDPAPLAPPEVPAAPTGIRRDNPRDQGALGFADAVGWFAAHGYLVSIPLIDNQPYDLVVDDGRDLARVQVKTTRYRSRYGVFVVSLETAGGNQSFHTRKPFEPSSCELLYALTDHGERYVIPTAAITSERGLSLGARVARYRVR